MEGDGAFKPARAPLWILFPWKTKGRLPLIRARPAAGKRHLPAKGRPRARVQGSRRPLPKAKQGPFRFLLRKGPKISKSERAPAKKRSLGKLRLGLFLLLALLKLLHSMLPAAHVIIYGDGHRP